VTSPSACVNAFASGQWRRRLHEEIREAAKVIAAARAGSLSPMTIAQAECFIKTLKYEEAYR